MISWKQRLLIPAFCFTLLFAPAVQAEPKVDPNIQKILEVYELINRYHVGSTPPEQVAEGAVYGMIDSLFDPHTAYFTDEELQDFVESIEGTYTGIGAVMGDREGEIVVHQVLEGSPAQKAGLRAGDILIEVDQEEVSGQPIEAVIAKVKGEAGTKVKIKLIRDGELMEVEIVRQKIELPTVASRVIQQHIGYIALATFTRESVQSFKQEFEKLSKNNLKGFILDLRDNPGGLLHSAVELSSFFLKEGPIVHVKNKQGEEQSFHVKNGREWDLPLVILTNDLSASSSEIVAGALKDYGKATLIGTRTFGKGTVQEIIPLQTGGYLKLTIEEYFTPHHQTINHVGVTPHILVGDREEQLQAAVYVLTSDNIISLKNNGNSLINYKLDDSAAPVGIHQNGHWYVSVRKLAYLFHGEIGYNPEKREVTLKLGHTTHSFRLDKNPGMIILNGSAYIELNHLLQKYNQIEKTSQEGEITLRLKP